MHVLMPKVFQWITIYYSDCSLHKAIICLQNTYIEQKLNWHIYFYGAFLYLCSIWWRDAWILYSFRTALSSENVCSCGSVVEHCVSIAKEHGFDSQGTHILIRNVSTECKSLRWNASAKWVSVWQIYHSSLVILFRVGILKKLQEFVHDRPLSLAVFLQSTLAEFLIFMTWNEVLLSL